MGGRIVSEMNVDYGKQYINSTCKHPVGNFIDLNTTMSQEILENHH